MFTIFTYVFESRKHIYSLFSLDIEKKVSDTTAGTMVTSLHTADSTPSQSTPTGNVTPHLHTVVFCFYYEEVCR